MQNSKKDDFCIYRHKDNSCYYGQKSIKPLLPVITLSNFFFQKNHNFFAKGIDKGGEG